ncbi:MAG: RimK family protein [Deltaproteobacteria bacterium]|nr:RimK family protein [Deltaproteobacteria bacterium]MBN2674840.1 RimK family protein [Deltaproteobacteria bacterium]
MKILLVVANAKKWPLNIPDCEVVSARKYLTEPVFSRLTGVRVFNLMYPCRYQSQGYYVSLLAEARGHRPVPNITTLRDLHTPAMVRMTDAAIQEIVQKSLSGIKSDRFELSIYFGRNLAKRYDRLSRELFTRFHAHFLRAVFVRNKDAWVLQNISPISINEIPQSHHPFVEEAAANYFAKAGYRQRKIQSFRYSLAILHNPEEKDPPSNPAALKKFIRAGQKQGLDVQLVTKEDFGRLSEFDALFIRETTNVNNHTFRFARYAEADGQVVIDDPQSIIRCANKVFLAELLEHQRIATPKTMIVHKDNVDLIQHTLGIPCVLKQPDSAFSMGVKKVDNGRDLIVVATEMLAKSELIIAQEYLPTEFDWRVGILDGKVIFVCRYYMAQNHWQVVKRDQHGKKEEGEADTLSPLEAPDEVIRIALRAASPIGCGLYGVDIKQVENRFYVIEVNDNPNIDAGLEDALLQDDLYHQIMVVFLQRIEQKKMVSKVQR